VLLLSASLATAEPPSITALVPAGGQRGQQVEVTIQGKLGTPPLSIWSNRPELQAEFPEKPDKSFTLTIPESTPPGLAFLRVYNAEGASALRPFVIGTLPEVAEDETNNSLSQAQTLESPQVVVNGALRKNGDVDTYAISLEKGQTLVAAITANRDLGSPMDGVLQIVSAKGFVLDQNDDDRGNDPLIAFEVPETGTYYIRTFGFPATPNSSIRFSGGEDWIYRLTLTTGPYADHIQPLAVKANSETAARAIGWNLPVRPRSIPLQPETGEFRFQAEESANPVDLMSVDHPVMTEPFDETTSVTTLPVTLSGQIAETGEVDSIQLEGKKGATLSITAEARAIGSQLDPVLRLVDSDGNRLEEEDDSSREERDAVLSFTPKADGPIVLQIFDRFEHGGERYFYRVTVEPPQKSYRLSVAADAFKLDADKPLELPVTVDRDRGFNEEIQVTVQGLPEGMTAEPVVSEAKGDSSKKVTLKLEHGNIESFSGPIQISGTAQGETEFSTTATIAVAGTANRSDQLWLTVPAKPEPKEEPEDEKK
jgi:hypothetical protein